MPPHNRDAEQSLLSVLISYPEEINKVINYLTPQDFYFKNYELIYSALLSLYDETSKIDLVTLADKLQFQGTFQDVGEHVGLVQIMDVIAAMPSHVVKYAKLIKRSSIRRKLIYSANQLEKRSFDEEEDLEKIFSLNEMRIGQIENEYDLCFKEEGMRFGKAMEEVINRRAPGAKGYTTGLPLLDENTMGLKKGHLWFLYASPGTGKTFNAIQYAHHILKKGGKVRFLSLEMAAEEIWDRLIRLEQNGDEDDGFVYDRASEWDFVVEDEIFTMNQIKRYIKQHAEATDVFVIDYLGLIENESKLGEIDNIILGARELQKIAKKNNACLLTLAQSNTEERGDDYTVNIKGGNSVKAVADVIVKLERIIDENHVDSAFRETLRVSLQKNKHGKSFTSSIFNINPETGGIILT